MKTISYINIVAVGCLAMTMWACRPARYLPLESIKTEGLYGDTLLTDSTSLADKPWNALFTDSLLQELIREGLDNNLDLKIAVQKELEAEAYFKESKADLLPDITAGASDNYAHNSSSLYPEGPVETNVIQLGLSANWELDIWGKLRSYKRAAYAQLLASDAGKRAVQTRLISDIVSGYYNLLALDAKLAITRQTVLNNADLVETMRSLQRSGIVTGAAIVQSEAARYAAEVIVPDLEQEIKVTQNALCLLLGRTGGTIVRGKLEEQKLSPLLQIGVPSKLLDNRPDVIQAEYNVMNSYELTKSAKAYFYPSLTITASGGLAAAALKDLLDPASFASNVIGGLTQPVFERRANITRLKVARAQQEESLLNLRYILLGAGNEVQNALSSYKFSVTKKDLRNKQLEALQNSVDYSKQLLTYGSANYTEVLYAQQSLLTARLSSIDDHVQQLSAVVTLYRALGGGWK